MNLNELRNAETARREYECVQEQREALADMCVVSVSLGCTPDDLRPIQLTKGLSGTGSVTSIGFPSDLAIALSEAITSWLDRRESAAKDTLKSLGVDVR
jgi:hypothetical protein